MELARRQAALARLAVDADLRSRFFESPRKAAGGLDVTPEEAQELAEQVEGLPQFARSLLNKRLGEVRRLLPQAAELAGKRFDEEFRRFAERNPPRGVHRHQRDALALADRLKPLLQGEAREALLYESGWIEARLGRVFVVRRIGPARFAVWLRVGRRLRQWRIGPARHWTNEPRRAQESS